MADYTSLKIVGANGDENVTTGGDYAGRDISSLDDQPNLTAAEMKARFDALVKQLMVPRFNTLLNKLSEKQEIHIGMFRALVSASAEYTDFEVPWALKDMPVVVTAYDSVPKVIPKSAVCDKNGIVRVFWQTAPSSSVGSTLSIMGGV